MSNLTREDWLNNAVIELRPIFKSIGYPLPDLIRVTCGFPSRHARSLNKATGEHWSAKASDDNTHEVCISPVLDEPLQVFGVLVHELAHCATDGDGHKGRFPGCVRKLWLEGKPTATVVGQRFTENFNGLVEGMGAYPHARLNVNANKKTQSTRMLKAVCKACGFTIRLSSKWADQGLPICSNDNNVFTLS